jgi:putative ABC transport system permease protein
MVTDRGEHTFPVVGVYYDYSTDQGRVLMFDTVYHQYWDDREISSVAVYLEPGADLTATIEHLDAETLADYDVVIQDYRTLRDWVFHVFERAFTITTALQVLATAVAFIGILSALMSLQLEHTREYGVMRAVGMTPRQLWNFTLIQTGLMGTTAGLLALPIGFVLALVLIYVINVRSFGWTMFLTLAPNEFIPAFAVALVAALVAGMYPAWRLSKLVTARALRNE